MTTPQPPPTASFGQAVANDQVPLAVTTTTAGPFLDRGRLVHVADLIHEDVLTAAVVRLDYEVALAVAVTCRLAAAGTSTSSFSPCVFPSNCLAADKGWIVMAQPPRAVTLK